jgi:hypothetical protein
MTSRMRFFLPAFVLLVLGLAPLLRADGLHTSYTFAITNAPGEIGNFSWVVTTPSPILGFEAFNTFNFVSPPSTGGGCGIKEVDIFNEGSSFRTDTFFSPNCLGVFDAETSGMAFVAPGLYESAGTNPDDTPNASALAITETSLRITTPEPNSLLMMVIAFPIFVIGKLKGYLR